MHRSLCDEGAAEVCLAMGLRSGVTPAPTVTEARFSLPECGEAADTGNPGTAGGASRKPRQQASVWQEKIERWTFGLIILIPGFRLRLLKPTGVDHQPLKPLGVSGFSAFLARF